MKKCPRAVIVGAVFGGLQAAQSIANQEVEVILIDRNNYHTIIPLYQMATAQLAPEQVAVPIRTLLRRSPHNRITQVFRRLHRQEATSSGGQSDAAI